MRLPSLDGNKIVTGIVTFVKDVIWYAVLVYFSYYILSHTILAGAIYYGLLPVQLTALSALLIGLLPALWQVKIPLKIEVGSQQAPTHAAATQEVSS